jgi:hypothetical protein
MRLAWEVGCSFDSVDNVESVLFEPKQEINTDQFVAKTSNRQNATLTTTKIPRPPAGLEPKSFDLTSELPQNNVLHRLVIAIGSLFSI